MTACSALTKNFFLTYWQLLYHPLLLIILPSFVTSVSTPGLQGYQHAHQSVICNVSLFLILVALSEASAGIRWYVRNFCFSKSCMCVIVSTLSTAIYRNSHKFSKKHLILKIDDETFFFYWNLLLSKAFHSHAVCYIKHSRCHLLLMHQD
jgi:hypothetical protein